MFIRIIGSKTIPLKTGTMCEVEKTHWKPYTAESSNTVIQYIIILPIPILKC